MAVQIYFSDYFGIEAAVLQAYGTVDISLVSDLPLFIDPFLLFNSDHPDLRELHDEIIEYVRFLRDKADAGSIKAGLLAEWYCFPEVAELWFGYSEVGNKGSGLGMDFARKLHANLHKVFRDFGEEQVAQGSHLEKLCLIESGVGRDNISDFTANLIRGFLATYTAEFAAQHLDPAVVGSWIVPKARFNYETESWAPATFKLPSYRGECLLLAPRTILTKDETWINKKDMIDQFPDVLASLDNETQRAKINNYFLRRLPGDREAKPKERREAAQATIHAYPELIDYFIRLKEEAGDEAVSVSASRLETAERQFIDNVRELVGELERVTGFYGVEGRTNEEARARVAFLKDVIENKGAWRLFYVRGEPITLEEHLQIVFRFTWCGTRLDVSREVNDGRGPADYKISLGLDKTIVEFKLARNRKLKQNLDNQAEIYAKASDAQAALKVIMFFSDAELARVTGILKEVGLLGHPDVVLIDARPKRSASNVA